MMKFHAAIATCLATYFVAGTAQESEALLALGKQLKQTEHSLNVMNQLNLRKDTDPQSVTALLLSATEPAAESQAELDRRLSTLQRELSVMHMETEIILGTSGAPEHHSSEPLVAPRDDKPGMQPLAKASQPNAKGNTQEAPQLVSGLSPYVLSILNTHQVPKPKDPGKPLSKADAGEELLDSMPKSDIDLEAEAKRKSVKLTGYSADPMLQANAAYRAGLFNDCLTILRNEKGASADHLRARCLTRLDRLEEAILSLTRIIKMEADSQLGKRAAKDLEFAQWMLDAKQKLMRADEKESNN